MSVTAISWAMKRQVAKSTEKFVLVCLANYADEHGIAYPSIAALESDTAQDRKTVIRGLRALIEAGWIEDTGERAGVTKQIPVYRLRFDNSAKSGTVEDPPNSAESGTLSTPETSTKSGTVPRTEQFQISAETVPFFPGNSTVFPRKGSQKRYTEPSGTVIEPSGNQKKRAARAIDRPDDVPEQVWADFGALRRAKRAPLNETALAGIQREAAKAGVSLAEALAVCCQQGWQGFNAGWYANLRPRNSTGPPLGLTPSQQLQQTTIAGLTGRRTQPGTIDVDAHEVPAPSHLR
ncbi:MAG: helix-turn-helix domain-containing protein [Steroidobacteraceae bacterium]|nr:helix-turn-helix domain-containing protein [Steroidobacteraceae bacterium]